MTYTRTRTPSAPTPEEMPAVRAEAIATLREQIEAEVLSAVRDVTPKDIAASIADDFQKIKRKIMLQVLGIDLSWGDLRLDSGNRSSPLLAWLQSEIGADVEASFRAAVRKEWEAHKEKAVADMATAARRYIKDTMGSGTYEFRKYMEEMCATLRKEVLDSVRREMFPELPAEAFQE